MRILIAGPIDPGTMMRSYMEGFVSHGHQVRGLSIGTAASDSRSPWLRVQRVPLLNRVGAPQLIAEGNRSLTREAMRWRPDLLLTTGDELLPGALATIAASVGCRTAFVYPDPLVNLQPATVQCLALYDVVIYACGSFGLPYLERLGARRAVYLPFAWDDALHPRPGHWDHPSRAASFDVVFVGNWRKDREAWLQHLSHFRVGVWGTDYWRWRAQATSVGRKSWQGGAPQGEAYVRASRAGKITLNLVDLQNGPGLNMRAFEALGMGCFVLSTRTEALQEMFVEGEHIAYFENPDELQEKTAYYLTHPDERRRIAHNAARLAESHTYRDRAGQLLELLAGI